MKTKTRTVRFALVACAATAGTALVFWYEFASAPRAFGPPEYPIEQYLRYSFNLRNRGGELIEHATFRAFAPVKQTATQRVEALDASAPFTLSVDDYGNQLMEFSIDRLPPYGTRLIQVTVALRRSGRPNRMPTNAGPYLTDAPMLDIDHPEIEAAAANIARDSATPLGASVSRWVHEHVRDTGFDPDDRGALYALRTGSGDCTEFSQLVTALLRQRGIPARTVGGFIAEGSVRLVRAGDYHNWAEYLVDGAWILADAQRGVDDEDYEHYIAFRIIGSNEGHPMSNSDRFLAFDPRLSVSMN